MKFFNTIKNIFSIEELRTKLYHTLFFVAIYRLGSFVILPGVDPSKLVGNSSGILDFVNVFLGGAFNRASVFALGIMPYISASIIIQLMGTVTPYFQRLQREGESGTKKMNQITRALTVLIAVGQTAGYIASYIPAEAIVIDRTLFTIMSTVILTTGTIFAMWLGEKITDKGLSNGISVLIMVGIISGLPSAIAGEFRTRGSNGLLLIILEFLALLFVIMGIVLLTQAVRRIPLQYARQMANSGKGLVKGKRSYLPLKVNLANVMPIIFAQSIMFVPAVVAGFWAETSDFAKSVQQSYSSFTSLTYNVTFALLIIFFTFFYTALVINPTQLADNLKKQNAFIPGIKPGSATAQFISAVLDRITLPGALFLTVVAVLPAFAYKFGVTQGMAQFYGGTSLIIIVGVILDILEKIEEHLLMRHYDGMMKTGKVKGRSTVAAVA